MNIMRPVFSIFLHSARREAWSVDPQIKVAEDKQGPVFDALEDMDADACLSKCVELSTLNKPGVTKYVALCPGGAFQ